MDKVIAVKAVCKLANRRKVVADMQFTCQEDLTQWVEFLKTNQEINKIELILPCGRWAEYARLPLIGWDKKEGGK